MEEDLHKHQFVMIAQIAEGRAAGTNVGVSGRGILVVVRMVLKILMKNKPLLTTSNPTRPTILKKSKGKKRVEVGDDIVWSKCSCLG